MYTPLILPDLRVMLQEKDAQGLAEFCDVLYPAVTAEIVEGLDPTDVWELLSHAPLSRQVEIFEFLTLPKQVELVDSVDRKRLSRLMEEMSPDNRVDLLSRMDPDHVDALLPLIAQAERADIRKLLSYPEYSAGAIMTTEYASLPANISAAEAIDRLRKQAPDRETIYYVYIIDEGRRLQGFVSLRGLILAKPSTMLSDMMRLDVISVRVDDDQEFVAREIARYDFLAIPVVDNQNQLVGIITHDDILDVMQDEATEDAHLLGAVAPLDDSYLDTPLRTLVWKRGIWLMILAVVSLMTAEVLQHYQSISSAHVWLIMFLPLILASGGNAGSQSATLTIRALALDEMSRRENLRLARRELVVGSMLGLTLAMIGFSAAATWFGKSVQEAGVVAITVMLVVQMGTIAGAMLPLMFRKLGMDPALMSNPLIAALVDVFGVIIYFTVAITVLDELAG